MRYIITKLAVRVGDTETYEYVTTEIENDTKVTKINAITEEIAYDQYVCEWDDDEGYWSDSGGRVVHVQSVKEMTEEEYNIINKFM